MAARLYAAEKSYSVHIGRHASITSQARSPPLLGCGINAQMATPFLAFR